MPLVSVIIPNYNHAQFLKARIDSVLNQTYSNFEVIILDDFSTDNSVEIINSYKSAKRISHIVMNESNSGSPFKQWKKGLELAKGKYIWIAESDDFADVTLLEKCVEQFEKDSTLTLAFCNTQPIDGNDNKMGNKGTSMLQGKYHALKDDFFYNWFFKNGSFRILNASSCVFRKDLINSDTLNKFITYKYAGDKLFWLDLLSEHPYFYFLSETLNYQRSHQNTTRANLGIVAEYCRNSELTAIYKLYKSKGLKIKKEANIEIAKRLFAVNSLGIFLHKIPNIRYLINSIYHIGFNFNWYKRIARIILKGL